jgi:hypothetical protein
MSPFDKLKADVLIPLLKSNPNASDNEIFRLATRRFEADHPSRVLAYEYFIKNALASVERVKPQGDGSIAILPRARSSAPAPAPVRVEVEHRVTAPETRKAIVAEVKRVAPTAPVVIQKKVAAEVEKRFEHHVLRAQIAAEATNNLPDSQRPVLRQQAVSAAVAKAVVIEVPKAVEKIDRIEAMKVEAIACVLLDHVLPNGLAVRDATFGDMAVFGNWGLAVSKLGPASAKVGGLRGVSEGVLQNIMKRFTIETQTKNAAEPIQMRARPHSNGAHPS